MKKNEKPNNEAKKEQPVAAIKLGAIRASVWRNVNNGIVRYNVTINRSYKDAAGNWKQSDSFGRDDLLIASKALDMAYMRIIDLETAGNEDLGKAQEAVGEAARREWA